MSRGDRDTADRRAGLLPPMLSTEAQSDLGVALATPRGASDGGIRLGIQPQATHRRRLPSCSAHAALRPVLLLHQIRNLPQRSMALAYCCKMRLYLNKSVPIQP